MLFEKARRYISSVNPAESFDLIENVARKYSSKELNLFWTDAKTYEDTGYFNHLMLKFEQHWLSLE